MPIRFQCSHCGKDFNAPDSLGGKRARCNTCHSVVEVPLASQLRAVGDDPLADDSLPSLQEPIVPASTAPATTAPTPLASGPLSGPRPSSSGALALVAVLVGLVVFLGFGSFIAVFIVARAGSDEEVAATELNKRSSPHYQPRTNSPIRRTTTNRNQPTWQPPTSTPPTNRPVTRSPSRTVTPTPIVTPQRPPVTRPIVPTKEEPAPPVPLQDQFDWTVPIDPPPTPIAYKEGKFQLNLPEQGFYIFPKALSNFVAFANITREETILQVYDLRSSRKIGKAARIKGNLNRDYDQFHFTADGRYFVARRKRPSQSEIGVWSFFTGEGIKLIDPRSTLHGTVLLDGPTHHLVVAHKGARDLLYDCRQFHLETGERLGEIELKLETSSIIRSDAIATSPGGRVVAVGLPEEVAFFELATGKCLGVRSVEMKSNKFALAFSPTGTNFAMATDRGFFNWDISSGELVGSNAIADLESTSRYDGMRLAWLPDGTGAVVDGFKLVDAETGSIVWEFNAKVESPQRMLDWSRILTPLSVTGGRGMALKATDLPKAAIEETLAEVRTGGKAIDAALPPLSSANLFTAVSAERPSGLQPWEVPPIEPLPAPKYTNRDIPLGDDETFVRTCVISGGEEPMLFVYYRQDVEKRGRETERTYHLQRFSLATGRTSSRPLDLLPDYRLIDSSSSGKLALVGLVNPYGSYSRLDLLQFEAPNHICGWRPYGDQTVVWARMVDDDHVMTMNAKGKIIGWKVPECEATFVADSFGYPLALSPRKKHFVVFDEDSVLRIYDTRTGECRGSLESKSLSGEINVGAFSPDGTKFTAVNTDSDSAQLISWDMKTGLTISTAPLPNLSRSFGTSMKAGKFQAREELLRYHGPNALLLDNTWLINAQTNVVTWQFDTSRNHTDIPRGQSTDSMVVVGSRDFRGESPVASVYSLATTQGGQSLNQVRLADQLIIGPGVPLAVEANVAAADPGFKQRVEADLTKQGFLIDDTAPTLLKLTGHSRTLDYMEFVVTRNDNRPGGFNFSIRPRESDIIFRTPMEELSCEATIIHEAKEIWKKEVISERLPSSRTEKSPQEILADARKEMAKNFREELADAGKISSKIPRLLFRPVTDAIPGKSTLSVMGEEMP